MSDNDNENPNPEVLELEMFRYLTDVEGAPPMSSEEQTSETARILGILEAALT